MGIEIIGKLTQKNNGDFKLVDLENVDYDGTGKSAKQELEKKIEEAKNSSTPYDDSAIKADIQTLKTNEVNLVTDETSMEGIKDNEYPTLTTTDKTLIGSINEVNAQYKDIANNKADNICINVKDFGAKGDSVTDDTKAIQDAINKCEELFNNGFTSIYFPEGKYLVNGALNIMQPIKIFGSNRNSPSSSQYGLNGSTILSTTTNSSPVITFGSLDTNVNCRQGPTIENLSFMGVRDTMTDRDCLKFNRVGWEMTMRNVFIRFFKGYAMDCYNVYDSVIENCSFINCYKNENGVLKYSIRLTDDPNGDDFTNAMKFTNCHFEHSRWFLDLQNARDNIFTSCKFENATTELGETSAPTIKIGKRCIENIFNACTFMCVTDNTDYVFRDEAESSIKQLSSIIINGCSFVNGNERNNKVGAKYIKSDYTKFLISNCLFSTMDGESFGIDVVNSTISNCNIFITEYQDKFYGVRLKSSILENCFIYAHKNSDVYSATDIQGIHILEDSLVGNIKFYKPYNDMKFPYDIKYYLPNESSTSKINRSYNFENCSATDSKIYDFTTGEIDIDLQKHNSNTLIFSVNKALTFNKILKGCIGEDLYIINEGEAITLKGNPDTYDGTCIRNQTVIASGTVIHLKKNLSQWIVV
mgnify:CR=1 FL=1